jgi:tetratricopeptide (TPR) repeat protein
MMARISHHIARRRGDRLSGAARRTRDIALSIQRGARAAGAAAVFAAVFLSAVHGWAQSDAPDNLYRNGIQHFTSGNYAEAARFFDELLRFFGKEPSLQEQMEGVYYAYGCALYNVGKFAEAIETFKQYADRYPKAKYRDEALYRTAAAHQNLNALDSAIEAYRQLLSAYPASAFAEDAAYQIGMCRLLQNRSADAVQAFREFMKACSASENWGAAGAFAARALFDLGKPAEALAQLQEIEKRPLPWSVVTYANLLAFEIGDTAYDNTDYELALRAYRRVKTRRLLLRKQREAVQTLKAEFEALQKEQSTPGGLSQRFQRERRLSAAVAQAEEMLRKLESLPDYDASLFHRIGRCFFNVDRYWEARIAFQRVAEEAADEALREAAHFDLILSISRLRRFDELIAEADRYLDRYEPEWKRASPW